MVLTHPDEDHLAGLLGVVERYHVDLVLEGPEERPSSTFRAWREALGRSGVRAETLSAGQRLRLGRLEIAVLFAPKAGERENGSNESLVLKATLGEISFLLPGDTPAGKQPQLLAFDRDLRSAVFKVPHHGARDALDRRFLDLVSPELAVISVGADNPFGHPAPETLTLLAGRHTLRTDERGAIEAITDGKRLWVRTRR